MLQLSSSPQGITFCATSAIAWRWSEAADPEVSLQRQHISDWIDVWLELTAKERDLALGAGRIATVMRVSAPERWKLCIGLISGTICTLLDHDWLPVLPDDMAIA